MNLHGLARAAIGVVNPFVDATLFRSSGAVTGRGGTRTPQWSVPGQSLKVQKQALSQSDLRHVDMLNIQGEMVKIWMDGAVYGVVRKGGEGGDLVVFNADTTPEVWLVRSVMEVWPDWCSVIGVLQLDLAVPS